MSTEWERDLEESLDFCDWERVAALIRSGPVALTAHLDQMKSEFEEVVSHDPV